MLAPLSDKATQDGEPILWRRGRKEIGNSVFGSAWTREKLYRPFRYSPFLYTSVPTWSGFINVFLLQDQSQGFFRAWTFL